MNINEIMMDRCLQLAEMGLGAVAPNPVVGAVLVHEGKIIGEGYHQQYGKAHAEVNCLDSVLPEKRVFIPSSTLYVSLEPCVHFGKTPPCTDRIIAEKIPRVVVGCIDPFSKVSGKGIMKMQAAGIEVATGVKEQACKQINRRFFTFYQKKRPYIILKWAQSEDGFMALPGPAPVKISGPVTNRIVHKWRSEEQAILVGANTALIDNPRLTNRLWTGPSPLRIVLDRHLKLPASLHVFEDGHATVVYNLLKSGQEGSTTWIKLPAEEDFIPEVFSDLTEKKIISVLVEGGRTVLDSFIEKGCWDEARVITGRCVLQQGLAAPVLNGGIPVREIVSGNDRITYFENTA